MVKVRRLGAGKIAAVSGAECEVMLFYCFWQTRLWPDWMDHSKLGDKFDAATRQHKLAITNANSGRELLLCEVGGEGLETACRYAIDRCRLLGIEVDSA